MSFKLFDRVQETTATTGTGTISMGGAVTGYRAFSSVFTTGDTTHYVLSDGTNWEVGLGTLTTGTPWTMARTTILSSSNAGAVVNFPGPTTNVWVDGSAQQLSVAPQFSGQITSTVATGTAPLVVASTTTVANLAAATATTATSATTAGSVTNAVTFNSGGAGAASGTTYNGGSAVTISYNTLGAQVAGSYVPLNGALGTPTSGTLTNCTFPTLNQSTTGTAAGLSGASPALGTNWSIDANGQPNNSGGTLYIAAYRAAANTTSGTVVNMSTQINQQGTNFTNSSGTITIVAIGVYEVSFFMNIVSTNTNNNFYFGGTANTIYGPNSSNQIQINSGSNGNGFLAMTAVVKTTAASQTLNVTSVTTFTATFYAQTGAHIVIRRVA